MNISIDLWGTLIKSSPLFHLKKTELTKEFFSCSEMLSNHNFKTIKNNLDCIIERTGWQPSKELIIKLLNSYFSPSDPNLLKTIEFYRAYQDLAIKYPPLLYSEDTIKYLRLLSENHLLILSSNTLLLEAKTLFTIIDNLGIFNYFTNFNFSSDLLVSKPNKEMYSKSHYHIGDNHNTDYLGAKRAGSEPIIINSNSRTIKDAYHIISERCRQ